jgi:hypothetical protein
MDIKHEQITKNTNFQFCWVKWGVVNSGSAKLSLVGPDYLLEVQAKSSRAMMAVVNQRQQTGCYFIG